MFMTDVNYSDLLKIHLHMPKTAGTTLKGIMKKNYHPHKVVDLYDRFQTHNDVVKRLRGLDVNDVEWLNCHLSFGIHNYVSKEATYLTFLRNPVDRILSDYYFIKSSPKHALYNELKEKSLKDFQNEEVHKNKQIKIILGRPLEQPVELKDLDQAKENINSHFCFIGITEMFTESVYLMKNLFNWSHASHLKTANRNVTKNRPKLHELDQVLKEEIVNHNEVDFALYEYMKQHLNEKLQQLDSFSKKELRASLIRKKYE